MSRTTIMAPDELLDQLRQIADEEGVSLGHVIREGLELRASTRRRIPSFIGAGTSGYSDTSRRVDEVITEYLDAKYPRS